MTFWTILSDHAPSGHVTLCDEHALEATNMGLVEHETAHGREPELFESMEEAAAIFAALLAAIGADLPITSAPTGTCGECGRAA